MKKQTLSVLTVFVLTAALFTGCGCRNSRPAETTAPTTMPTIATTAPTTEMTTMPTTMPQTEATIEDGNGPISTDATVGTDSMQERAIPGGIGSGNGITGSITGAK